MASKHRPQRSCVVCREKKDKRELSRLVFVEGMLRIDQTGKIDGRGAYLCKRPQCWEHAATGPMMDNALRRGLLDDDRSYLRQMKPS